MPQVMISNLSRRLERLNGWQRLWVVFAILLALAIAGVTAADWPSEPEHGPWERYQAKMVEKPSAQFDPDAYLAEKALASSSGKPRTLESILRDPNYINANDATKLAIFERWAPMDPSYATADEPTRLAIRQRFGIGDPTPEQKAALERAGERFALERREAPTLADLEKLRQEDRERLALERRDAEDRQRQELKERELSASTAKMSLLGAAVAEWLGIVLGVYALGWNFAWVRRGFRGGG